MATLKHQFYHDYQENNQSTQQLSKELRNIQIKRISFWLIYIYVLIICLIFDIDIIGGISFVVISCGFALFSARLHRRYIKIITLLQKENATDYLTQIYNKRAGLEFMSNALCLCKRSAQPVNIYIIDIDYFKDYNDTFGHLAGDKALYQIADCHKQCFCRNCDILCRLGGEEFAVMTVGGDQQQAIENGKRLQESIAARRIESGRKSVSPLLTVSIGLIHQTPAPNTKLLHIISQADHQLYCAKNHSRNCICCNDQIIEPETFAHPAQPESESAKNLPKSTIHIAADNTP